MGYDIAIIVISAAAFVVLLLAAFYNQPILRKYTIKSEKVQGGPLSIVLLSDLHSSIYGKNQQRLFDKVKLCRPDLVLLAGDIFDKKRRPLGTELFLCAIKEIAPVFYTLGNHEFKRGGVEKTKALIQSMGICLLDAEYIQINVNNTPVLIAGIEDPIKAKFEGSYNENAVMTRAFGGLEQIDDYKILIAHRPERIGEYCNYDFDLAVSGHAHGGQVRIPFLLNGLFAPDQGWFPRLAGGRYDYGKLIHLVSRGVSFMPLLPRVFNPPEVVWITLEAWHSESR